MYGRPCGRRLVVVAPVKKHRRQMASALLRPLATTVVLVGLYYLLPLDRLADVPTAVTLVVGMLILLTVAAGQVHQVLRSPSPAVRATEALATTVPLFLLLFASAYFTMSDTRPDSFNHALTRTDSLYFTVTVFATVGFGDITAVSQTARLAVTVQMILDLLVLGLGIQVFIGAVRRARQGRPELAAPDPPSAQ